MLARTAEQLFWSGRYLVRAEDTARLLDVTYHRLLEATPAEEASAWAEVLDIVGLADEFARTHDAVTAASVVEFLVLDRANPGSIVVCVERARLNGRGVREHLTVEFWEALNSFHLDMAGRNLAFQLRVQPNDLYRFVRSGVQSVLGTAEGTWTRDDGWRFFMLGVHLERAAATACLLRVRQPRHRPDEVHEWYATLRVTSALSAYRRRYRDLDPAYLLDLLLLSTAMPRSVLFSLRHAEMILREVVDATESTAVRLLGRARAELEFADADELLAAGDVEAFLAKVEQRIRDVANAVAAECFLYRVELDLHEMHVIPGEILEPETAPGAPGGTVGAAGGPVGGAVGGAP